MNDAHRIVSSEAEKLILVDANDTEIGQLSKAECHDRGGILHRAFSLFLFNQDGELLLQRRATSKRLWGGYWSNSCCSHPRHGESMAVATRRRMLDELNTDVILEYVYKFSYQASFGDVGAENELCHVYFGRLEEPVQANKQEIDSIRFITSAELAAEFRSCPERFTPWFKMEWKMLKEQHADMLARYASG